MKQSGHLNPSEETETGCPITSKQAWTTTTDPHHDYKTVTTKTGPYTTHAATDVWRRASKYRPCYKVPLLLLFAFRDLWKKMGTPIFRSLQNCQFHHRRLESLEHFNVLDIYIYILLSTTVSHFWTLRMPFFLKVSLFCIHFHFLQVHFACVLCI